MDGASSFPSNTDFTAAELGAMSHLYRGEVYRSTLWRTRLDQTTNWSIVTTGVALSLTFAGPDAPPLPLILVGLLVAAFLQFEARRYRYFNVWRARCRLMETEMYGPMLRGKGVRLDGHWNTLLAQDYARPKFHISFMRAAGRRVRKTYAYIFSVQVLAYVGKILIHPQAVSGIEEFVVRAAIGPVPGWIVLIAGALFHGSWMLLALVTYLVERRHRREQKTLIAIA